MRVDMALMVREGDAPAHRLDTSSQIPVISLDGKFGVITLQFDSDTPDLTIAYLDKLIAEATELRAKVQEARS